MTDSPPDAPSTPLVELARAHGVAAEFWDWHGRHTNVPESTIRAVLGALDVPCDDEAAVERSLADAADAPWRRTLPPVVVTREGRTPAVAVHVPHGDPVHAWVELEDGGTRDVRQLDTWVEPRTVDGALVGRATVEVPGDLPLGWHVLHAEAGGRSATSCPLVVTPERLQLPPALAGPAAGAS